MLEIFGSIFGIIFFIVVLAALYGSDKDPTGPFKYHSQDPNRYEDN